MSRKRPSELRHHQVDRLRDLLHEGRQQHQHHVLGAVHQLQAAARRQDRMVLLVLGPEPLEVRGAFDRWRQLVQRRPDAQTGLTKDRRAPQRTGYASASISSRWHRLP